MRYYFLAVVPKFYAVSPASLLPKVSYCEFLTTSLRIP